MSTMDARGSFFRLGGGTLDPEAPSYVKRPADEQLLDMVLRREYCNLLAARQMGKSSLMVRTAKQLRARGIRTADVDVSRLGGPRRMHQWYLGFLRLLGQRAGVDVNVFRWWRAHRMLSPVQRLTRFISEEILAPTDRPIVVFIDEIDSTLRLNYTDDFFAAIRSMFNERATNSEYKRLTVVLAGVARAADLIQDRSKTPYNIGHEVYLGDFDRESAQVLLDGLAGVPLALAQSILDRVLYWTGGHPYLTQQVCGTVAAKDMRGWTEEQTDRLIHSLFFVQGRVRSDRSLHRIDEYIRSRDCRQEMIAIYEAIQTGERIEDEERSIAKSRLKLSGLVKADGEHKLRVRNPIYERVFGEEWTQQIKSLGPLAVKRRRGVFDRLLGRG